LLADSTLGLSVSYGMTGFFLSMIYGPMTKVVAENTDPIHATRCSLGYTFASFFGSPLAGVVAAVMSWQSVFFTSSAVLFLMGAVCFCVFLAFERKGIVRYHQFDRPKEENLSEGVRRLLKHRILKFTGISILTGVVRTTVVFWLPTYIAEHLDFAPERATLLYSVATLFISLTAFVAVFLYEKLGRNMDKTILVAFTASALSFLSIYFIRHPALNLVFMVLAIMGANSAATMLWSRYCPSLRDTGMVSSATGYLDFCSYMAAAISSKLFANAVDGIGWGNLILIWCGLMVCGVLLALPYEKLRRRPAARA
jgi:predicted MFS family arabinose efflux permease